MVAPNTRRTILSVTIAAVTAAILTIGVMSSDQVMGRLCKPDTQDGLGRSFREASSLGEVYISQGEYGTIAQVKIEEGKSTFIANGKGVTAEGALKQALDQVSEHKAQAEKK